MVPRSRGSPQCFWGSALEELHNSPENWLQKKSNCLPINNPMAQVYSYVSLFEERLAFRRFWVKEPHQREKYFSGYGMCYLYRRTPHYCVDPICLLRGTIDNRTYAIHKHLYIYPFLSTVLGKTMVPRNSKNLERNTGICLVKIDIVIRTKYA